MREGRDDAHCPGAPTEGGGGVSENERESRSRGLEREHAEAGFEGAIHQPEQQFTATIASGWLVPLPRGLRCGLAAGNSRRVKRLFGECRLPFQPKIQTGR